MLCLAMCCDLCYNPGIMFFCIKKSKSCFTLQLLESYRDGASGAPSNRVVASLGRAPIPRCLWKEIAAGVGLRMSNQPVLPLSEHNAEVDMWIGHVVSVIARRHGTRAIKPAVAEMPKGKVIDGVLADAVGHTRSSVLGPTLLGLHVWKQLGMDMLLCRLGYSSVQARTAAASVLSRLVDPMSENALSGWLPESCFADIFGDDFISGLSSRLYRVSDKLISDRERIEEHMRDLMPSLLGFQRTLLLYDLTNTHFEGDCGANPKALRGKNKQKRNDCPQIVVGMIFDEYGFELGHKTFPGNMNDSKSLALMLDELEKAGGGNLPCRALVIIDAGIASRMNIRLIRERGFGYLVNDSRRRRAAWKEEFEKDGFEEIPGREADDSVLVKIIEAPDGAEERIILCKSRGRREKENAILSRAENRFLEDLGKLALRVEKRRLTDPLKIERAIGRTASRNTRASHLYQVRFDRDSMKLEWSLDAVRKSVQESLSGCYVLRTSSTDLGAPDFWRLYMTLSKAEDGFNSLKHDVGLRPNYHQIETRVDAHIFITVLAYQIVRYITYVLERSGDRREWTAIKRQLSTHCYATVMLPTKDGRIHWIRKPGMPEQEQWEIYRKFGINSMNQLPERRRISESARSATL